MKKSNMMDRFSQTPSVNIPRSTFKVPYRYTTTLDVDYLYPFYVDIAYPGDSFKFYGDIFARLNTPIHPLMDNILCQTFFFEVPIRILWENWRKFMGERYDPDDSIDYSIPQTTKYKPQRGSLSDYLGLPTQDQLDDGAENGIQVSALPFRAIRLIWNEWFRDQNLQDSLEVKRDNTDEDVSGYEIPKINKRFDYFTQMLPWPQKGDAIDLPLGTSAPVSFAGSVEPGADPWIAAENFSDDKAAFRVGVPGGSGSVVELGNFITAPSDDNQLIADLSTATAATINQLRRAFQIQRLLEKDARGGTRYIEIIKAHFNVNSPDGRAWRPVYLGGGKSYVNIQQVAQTSSTDQTTPKGDLAAFGIMNGKGHNFNKSFTEHCLIIGLVAFRADLTYSQGIRRFWSDKTRYDFYWPSLAHIGEQEVYLKELYAKGTDADDKVLGYVPRYDHLRYIPSLMTNHMRPQHPQTLASWHLSQEFENEPALNSDFIEANTPVDRVVAVTTQPDFLIDIFAHVSMTRPMPLHGIPGMLDRF